MNETPTRWYKRGYLPHCEGSEIIQFVTFRLADSLPESVIDKWKDELDVKDPEDALEFRNRIERYLDNGHGRCYLKDPRIGDLVRDSLLHLHGKRYELFAWVIMPNHVHLLLRQMESETLASILHSLKSFTAHRANKILDRSGGFWQHESFDRFIRNERHFRNVVNYIEENPVKAGLCDRSQEWPWSSATPLPDDKG